MAKKTNKKSETVATESAPVAIVTTDTGTAEVAPVAIATTEAAPAEQLSATAPESLEDASPASDVGTSGEDATDPAGASVDAPKSRKRGKGGKPPERPPIRDLKKRGTPAAPAPKGPESVSATPTPEPDAPRKPRGRPRKDGLPPGSVTVLTPAPLSTDERTRLEEIERAVDSDIETATDAFSRVSRLLHEVHEKKLYRESAKSFPEYVEKRFKIGGRMGWHQVAAAGVLKALEGQGVTNLPKSESQARPLAQLTGEPEKLVQAWEIANELATAEGKQEPERKHSEQAAARVMGKESPTTPATPAPATTPASPQASAVQAAQAAGTIPANVTIDVTPPDEDGETSEPPVDIEMRDDKWLAQFPLDSTLKGLPLKIFRAEALAYRWFSAARTQLIRTVLRPIVKEAVRDSGRSKLGPYLHRVRWGLSGPAPDKWVLCESCSGSGQVPTIGECRDCNGGGYRVPAKG